MSLLTCHPLSLLAQLASLESWDFKIQSDLDLTILDLTINLDLTIFSRETDFLLSKKSQFNNN